MINLRFHVVSLISVFLALAVGIAVGATVVDQGLLQVTRANLRTVEQDVDERNAEIRRVENERDDWQRLGTQSADRLVSGRLRGVPVLVLTSRGVDRDPIDALLKDLRTANADVVAQLTVNRRITLPATADVEAARSALGAASTRPNTIRFLLQQRMLESVLSPAPAVTLEPFRVAGLLESASGAVVPELPLGTRVAVVSGRGAELDDDAFLVPWLEALGLRDPARVVALEAPTAPAASDSNGGSGGDAKRRLPVPTFVNALRKNSRLSVRLSTVDNLDTLPGRLASVLAIEDLAGPVTGHYGVYEGADRLLPAPAS